MDIPKIVSHIDHTLLRADIVWEDVKLLCDEALRYKAASVCIPPCFVKRAAEYVSGGIPICTVVGFPNGYSTSSVKCFEAKEALANGASEIDMVVNIGDIKARRYEEIFHEIIDMRAVCGSNILKVIVEACMLTEGEKIEICELISDSGANYIKTSTGFASGGATYEDIELFAEHKKPHLKIKASGGIRTFEDAEHFIALGADRLGTSTLIKLLAAKEKE